MAEPTRGNKRVHEFFCSSPFTLIYPILTRPLYLCPHISLATTTHRASRRRCYCMLGEFILVTGKSDAEIGIEGVGQSLFNKQAYIDTFIDPLQGPPG